MSTLRDMIGTRAQWDVVERVQPPTPEFGSSELSQGWDPMSFGEQQMRGLIQEVFAPQSSRQIVFCAVDESTETAVVCAEISRAMAAFLDGTVCAVEGCASGEMQRLLASNGAGLHSKGPMDFLRVGDNLWLAPQSWLRDRFPESLSLEGLRTRLSDLQGAFDYTLIRGPVVGRYSDAALLGSLCDGVILVLEAHATRRAVAGRARALLDSANAHLLGTVLNQRTFPIPESIYRRL
jgi:hypothetical protein